MMAHLGFTLTSPTRKLTNRTFHNAFKLEHAVWSFAGDNGGILPGQIYDSNLAGKTLIDYLTGQQLLVNPFTQHRTEPPDIWAASPGELGYIVIVDIFNRYAGFMITAEGWADEDLEIFKQGTNLPDAQILNLN